MKAQFKTRADAVEYAVSNELTVLTDSQSVAEKTGTYTCNCGECDVIFAEDTNHDVTAITICSYCGEVTYDICVRHDMLRKLRDYARDTHEFISESKLTYTNYLREFLDAVDSDLYSYYDDIDEASQFSISALRTCVDEYLHENEAQIDAMYTDVTEEV